MSQHFLKGLIHDQLKLSIFSPNKMKCVFVHTFSLSKYLVCVYIQKKYFLYLSQKTDNH